MKSKIIQLLYVVRHQIEATPHGLLLRLIALVALLIVVLVWLPNSSVEINIRLNDASHRNQIEQRGEPEPMQPVMAGPPIDASVSFSINNEPKENKASKREAKAGELKKKNKKAKYPDWMYLPDAKQTKEQRFAAKYLRLAQIEREKYGIPVSIKLAQAILESNSGQSTLASKANNFFGIKGKHNGKYILRHDEVGWGLQKFRKYPSLWHSWRDHSEFLQQPRYARLKKAKNYKQYAYGLKECGYATAKHYPKALIRIIEQNKLYLLDEAN
jgi:flagellum-specific peptidoglycan hydrolase FlgJ